MLAHLPLIMRCVLGVALLVLLAGALLPRFPDSVGRVAKGFALFAVAALLILRIVLRVSVPEEVPSFSG